MGVGARAEAGWRELSAHKDSKRVTRRQKNGQGMALLFWEFWSLPASPKGHFLTPEIMQASHLWVFPLFCVSCSIFFSALLFTAFALSFVSPFLDSHTHSLGVCLHKSLFLCLFLLALFSFYASISPSLCVFPLAACMNTYVHAHAIYTGTYSTHRHIYTVAPTQLMLTQSHTLTHT